MSQWLSTYVVSALPAIYRHISCIISAIWVKPSEAVKLNICFASGRVAEYCDLFVCMSVCLSASSHIWKLTCPNFTKFSVRVTVAVARCYSDDNAMCYVLPVLWMTPFFHKMAPIGQHQRWRYVSSSSPGGTGGVKLLSAITQGWNSSSSRDHSRASCLALSLTQCLAPLCYGVRTQADYQPLVCVVEYVFINPGHRSCEWRHSQRGSRRLQLSRYFVMPLPAACVGKCVMFSGCPFVRTGLLPRYLMNILTKITGNIQ